MSLVHFAMLHFRLTLYNSHVKSYIWEWNGTFHYEGHSVCLLIFQFSDIHYFSDMLQHQRKLFYKNLTIIFQRTCFALSVSISVSIQVVSMTVKCLHAFLSLHVIKCQTSYAH